MPNQEVKEYTLKQGVEFYINYLKKHKENSSPITSFYVRFDPEKQEMLPIRKTGSLKKYYAGFTYSKRKGKLPKDLTFEDWIKPQIPSKLRKELEKFTEKYLNRYSLEQGVEFYIQHLKEHKENFPPIASFYSGYDAKTGEMLPRGKHGGLNRHYHKFARLRKTGKIPKDISFEDYLIHQLPEDKRERAEYYLKGRYLNDLIDGEKLKAVALKTD